MEKAFEIDEIELKKKLRQVVWDYDISDEDLLAIFLHDKKVAGIGADLLRSRLIGYFPWHSLLKLFGTQYAICNILTDNAIKSSFPRQYKDKLYHVKSILSR